MSARTLLTAAVALLLAAPAAGQDLRSRIEGAPDGTVRLSFAAREGVCGNGRNISTRSRNDDGWESDCEPGPVRLALRVESGRVTRLNAYVGGRWRPIDGRVTDLGTVSAPAASAWLLDLAERGGPGRGDPVFAATIADSTDPWPALLRIARSERAPRSIRKSAVFWLGTEAGEVATRGLAELVDSETQDREVRKHAVFALSQLPKDRGVPELIRVARTNRDPEVRKSAIFWLGQSDDPRALALFEELLARR